VRVFSVRTIKDPGTIAYYELARLDGDAFKKNIW